jgi:hypothetical protein
MKSFYKLAIAVAFLGSSVSAAPASVPGVNITITNEIDNRAAAALIPADGHFRGVPDLFANSALDQNGRFFGTSAQLTHFVDDTRCLIRSSTGDLLLNSSAPLVDLDGNPNVALLEPLLLNGFRIRCRM